MSSASGVWKARNTYGVSYRRQPHSIGETMLLQPRRLHVHPIVIARSSKGEPALFLPKLPEVAAFGTTKRRSRLLPLELVALGIKIDRTSPGMNDQALPPRIRRTLREPPNKFIPSRSRACTSYREAIFSNARPADSITFRFSVIFVIDWSFAQAIRIGNGSLSVP